MRKNILFMWSKYREIGLILFFALVIRLILFFILGAWKEDVLNSWFFVVSDTKTYHNLALGFLSHHNFNEYDYFRTPGYPLLISLIYQIFGVRPWVVLIFQIIINLFAIFLTYILAKEIFNNKIALIAAMLYAIEPHSILHTTILLSDTFLSSLFLSAACALYFSLSRKKISLLIVSAILLGITTYFKQISQYFSLVAIILLLVKNCSIPLKVKKVVLYLLFYFIIITPWMIHNYCKFGHFKFATTQAYNLLFDNTAFVESNITNKPIKEVRKEFKSQADSISNNSDNVFDISETYNQMALEYFKGHTLIYLKYHLKGIKNLFISLNTHTFMRHFGLTNKKNPVTLYKFSSISVFQSIQLFFTTKPTIEIIFGLSIALYLVFVYTLFIAGSYSIFREKNFFILFYFLSIILYFAILPGAIGYARYKLPIIPFYTIVSAAGFYYLRDKWKISFTKKGS